MAKSCGSSRRRAPSRIASLADRLGVSLETVRRDVKPLTSDGSMLKMHGAIGLPSLAGEAPFERRMRENADAKRVIARMVAATIRDGESIMLDTGTTTSFPGARTARPSTADGRHQFVRHRPHAGDRQRQQGLHGRRRIAQRFSGAAFGVSAIDFVSRFSVSHAVISTGAVDAVTRRHGLRSRRGRVRPHGAVAAASVRSSLPITRKFGRQGLVQVCGFDGFSELATDRPPPRDIAAALGQAGARLVVAGGETGL